ncbi:FtsX-like permease family protein [Cellulosimicrobium cellulans]|uniref:FtsX-like permease family protein n=1 Tax=Cellulosimicrobium cellulans TaxID=1710 RepID=UPI001651B5B3|nr:FtsX-like permease family protein [Cellulosimicrobium cellulans]
MTGRHRVRGARRRPGVDLSTLPRRAAAQPGPLVLVAVLVALVVALVAAVPRAVARVSDAAVQAAVARAGADTDLVLTTTTAFTETGQGYDGSAELAREAADAVASGLALRLGPVLRPPVVSTTSTPLALPAGSADPGAARGETSLRLVWTPADDAVEWTSGGEPAGPGTASTSAPVQVGLAEDVAGALGASAGDPLHLAAGDGTPVEALVSGVFRPADPDAATWHDLPDVLEPRVSRVGPATVTTAAALLSDDSLAAAVAAVGPREVQRTVRVAFEPGRVGAAAAERVLGELPAVQASPGTVGWGAAGGALHSSAVGVLRAAVAELAAARAAATALVVGGAAVGALLLVLVAGLLARRRTGELATRRSRGATLPALAAELAAEAVVVVGLGVAAGLGLAAAVVPGRVPVAAVLVVAAVAVPALPAAALRVARGDADPARGRAHGGVRDAGARRLAAELALVALAAGAVVVLRSGGAGDGGPARAAAGGASAATAAPDLLAAAAPALLAGVAAVLVARLLPGAVHRLAPLAERSRGAVPVLAVARARSDGLAPLPLLAVAAAAALVVVGASCVTAVRDGQEAAAWASVGGDARVAGEPDADLAAAAAEWSGAPGVTAAVAARVARDVPARTAAGSTRVDVVAGEPEALAALAGALAATGHASAAPGAGDPGTEVAAGGEVVLRWDGEERSVHALGLAVPRPSAGRDDARAVVAVDVTELGGEAAVPPTTVWLVGPGAEAAVRAGAPPGDAEVTARSAVLADLRADVLPRALVGAAAASVALLLAFVVLAVLVAAAAGGPARRRTLDTLRTVGLTDREAGGVAAGEVLPAALLASAAGAVAGWAVPPLVLVPLGLAGTGSGLPAAPGSVAWAAAALPVVAGLLAAAGVLRAEHARRRTRRLGEVLRTGA